MSTSLLYLLDIISYTYISIYTKIFVCDLTVEVYQFKRK